MTELKQFVVYKLSIDDQFYIGSTCNFKKRLSYHKYDCFNRNTTRYNKPIYQYIRTNNLNFEDIKTEILERVENIYNSDKENEKNARIREQYYIDREREIRGGNITNSYNAYTTEQEKKIQKTELNTAYYQKNKEKIAEYHAEWYQKNKEKIVALQAEYRLKNKERYSQKINCPCGSTTTVGNKSKHEKTIKHQEYLKSLEN